MKFVNLWLALTFILIWSVIGIKAMKEESFESGNENNCSKESNNICEDYFNEFLNIKKNPNESEQKEVSKENQKSDGKPINNCTKSKISEIQTNKFDQKLSEIIFNPRNLEKMRFQKKNKKMMENL